MDVTKDSRQEFVRLTAQVAAAYLSSNPVPAVQVPEVIRLTFTALRKLGKPPEAEAPKPAVPIKGDAGSSHLPRVRQAVDHAQTASAGIARPYVRELPGQVGPAVGLSDGGA
jgi:hypothetical protein